MFARLRCGGNLLLCLAFGTGVLGVLGVLWWLGGWVVGIRYRRGSPMVRNMRAVLKKASWGTRRIFRGTRCAKQASTVRKGYSVPETPSYGTGCIFKGPQNSRLHRLWTAHGRTGRIFSARNGPRSEGSRHKKRVTSKSIKTFSSPPFFIAPIYKFLGEILSIFVTC